MPINKLSSEEALPTIVGSIPKSVDQLIAEQQEALNALLKQKAEEEEKARLDREANMTPEERVLSQVQKILLHMDAQIVRLGGHSYRLYNL